MTCCPIFLKEKERQEVLPHTIVRFRRNAFDTTRLFISQGKFICEGEKKEKQMGLFQLAQTLFCLKPSITVTSSVMRTICHRRAGNHFLPSHHHLNRNATSAVEPHHTQICQYPWGPEISSAPCVTPRICVCCAQQSCIFWFSLPQNINSPWQIPILQLKNVGLQIAVTCTVQQRDTSPTHTNHQRSDGCDWHGSALQCGPETTLL